MKKEIYRILQRKQFFKTNLLTESESKYTFEKPSTILLQNIHIDWLNSYYIKTYKHFPVYNKYVKTSKKMPYGYVKQAVDMKKDREIIHHLCNYTPDKQSPLEFYLLLPQHDMVQSFLHWQRYRKYWWSSITTTPSLFTISEHVNFKPEVNIMAQFPWGAVPVETILAENKNNDSMQASSLCCSMSLEGALFILLLDALNSSNGEYLKFHRRMAPYKMSFALNYNDSIQEQNIILLAKHLYTIMQKKHISSWLPDFSLKFDDQIKESYQLGVIYIAILSENSLSNGFFHLLNTSTSLKEEVHIAEFDAYTSILFK